MVEAVELGLPQRKVATGTRLKAWLRNEYVRVGLAELLCTYIMMVRKKRSKNPTRQTDKEQSLRLSGGTVL